MLGGEIDSPGPGAFGSRRWVLTRERPWQEAAEEARQAAVRGRAAQASAVALAGELEACQELRAVPPPPAGWGSDSPAGGGASLQDHHEVRPCLWV